ncbi:MAG TPA: HAD family hydrolase [Steroidobacteraceae bacterium]|jgi:FMN phosphatase YigB (HAD superfamily)|nr:HAD family hydrolase [Steroidobacteraceae bacterium]
MASTSSVEPVVFLLDVDNTLFDNDALIRDLMDHLESEYGTASRDRYAQILESVRSRLGYVDYLGALQEYRLGDLDDPRLLNMSSFLVDYPFPERLYPNVMQVLSHLSRYGLTVILSDGDVVFQPRKVQRSGLWDAVGGRVLIYIHKEEMLDAVAAHYPARRYVMIDDKIRILHALKQAWGDRVMTVLPRQGHYAHDPALMSAYPPADLTVERIADLVHHDFSERDRPPFG